MSEIDQTWVAQHTKEADYNVDEFDASLGLAPAKPQEPSSKPTPVNTIPSAPSAPKGPQDVPATAMAPFQGIKQGLVKLAETGVNGFIDVVDGFENIAAKQGLGTGDLIQSTDRVDWSSQTGKPTDDISTRVMKTLIQYSAPMVATGLAGGGLAASMAAGAASDFMLMDPKNERLSTILVNDVPELKNYPVAYSFAKALSNNPDESSIEGRYKNMVEGALLAGGIAGAVKTTSGIFRGLSKIYAGRQATNTLAEIAASTEKAALRGEPGVIPPENMQGNTSGVVGATEPTAQPAPLYDYAPTRETPTGPQTNLNNDNVVEFVKNFAQENQKTPEMLFRGTKTFDELDAEAQAIIRSPEKLSTLLSWKLGERPLSDAETKAAQYIMAGTHQQLQEAAMQAVKSGNPEDLLHFKNLVSTFNYINEVRVGAGSEMGRALNAHKLAADVANMTVEDFNKMLDADTKQKLVTEALKMHGGSDQVADLATAVTAIGEMGPEEATKALLKSQGYREPGKVAEIVKYSLVNGLLTFKSAGAALVSNAFMLMKRNVDNYAAAGIGFVRGTKDAVTFAQANGYARANVASFAESLGSVWTAMTSNKQAGPANVLKLGLVPRVSPVSAEALNIPDNTWAWRRLGNMVDAVGYGLSVTSRLTASSDAFFGTMAYRGSRMQQSIAAAEQLSPEGKAGFKQLYLADKTLSQDMRMAAEAAGKQNMSYGEYQRFIQSKLGTTTVADHEAAALDAQTLTFAKRLNPASDSFIESTGARVDELLQEKLPIARVVFPFFRTNVNIVQSTIENSPLGAFAPSILRKIRAGGAEGDLALAKVVTGSGIVGASAWLAHEGLATGPETRNPDLLKALEESGQGWQPDSLLINGKYISMRRFEPFNSLLRLGATLNIMRDHLSDEDYTSLAHLAGAAVVDVATPEMLVANYGSFLNAFGEMTKYNADTTPETDKFLAGLAQRVVPSEIRDVRYVVDPYKLDTHADPSNDAHGAFSGIAKFTEAVVNQWKSQVPHFSESLTAERNMFAEPLYNTGGWASLFQPYTITAKGGTALMEKLQNLSDYYKVQSRVNPDLPFLALSKPSRVIDIHGIKMTLTNDEYKRFELYSAGYDKNGDPIAGKEGTLRSTLESTLESYKDVDPNMSRKQYEVMVGKVSQQVLKFRSNGKKLLLNDTDFMDRWQKALDASLEEKNTQNFQ